MSYIGQRPVVGRYIKLDQISSGFNGSNTGFSMTAGSQAVFPGTARNLLLSLGGVIQEPDTDFTISGSTLTFTTPPVANTTFFGVIYGDMQATGTPSDGTVLPASIASSGNFSFPEVTVTGDVNIADSIIHSGDTDTKIRFGAANEFSVETGGVERLELTGTETVFNDTGVDTDFRIEGDTNANLFKVDAGNDRVGIGTSSPQQVFHVYHAADNGLARFESGDANCRIDLVDNSGQISIEAIGNQLRFGTSSSNTERIRIDSSGHLLVNTSSVGGGSYDQLSVAGGIKITDDSNSKLEIGRYSSGSPHSYIKIGTNSGSLRITNAADSSDLVTITDSGRVGIGLTNGAAELDVAASVEDGTGTLAEHGIRLSHVGATDEEVIPITGGFVTQTGRVRAGIGFISKQASSTDGYAGEIGFYTRSAADGTGLLRSDERMRITSSGRLLIGTTAHNGPYDGITPQVVLEGTSYNTSTLTLFCNANAVGPAPQLQLGKSRGTTDGSTTIVANGDRLASIWIVGADGTDRNSSFAAFDFRVDGVPGENDTPGRIEFKTTSDGSANPSERMRLDSSGRLQIGSSNNSSTGTKFVVGSGNNLAATALINTQDTDINALTLSNWDGATTSNRVLIGFDSSGRGAFSLGMPAATNAFAFFGSIDGSSNERMRINSDGNVSINTTATPTGYGNLNVFGTDNIGSRVSIRRGSANNDGPQLWFNKSRNTTDGSHTVVQANDNLGSILFTGNDSQGPEYAARIMCEVDGTPGSNDMPGRLVFSVTPDGSDSMSEAMRIHNSGKVAINTTNASGQLTVNGTSNAGHYVPGASGGIAQSGIHVGGNHGNSGERGGAISFSAGGAAACAIACRNESTDRDQIGLEFFTHNNSDQTVAADRRLRISTGGAFYFGTQEINDPANNNSVGVTVLDTLGMISVCRNSDIPLVVGITGSDTQLIRFIAQGSIEGNISVSGSTVSYNGGHLSRWSQIKGISATDKSARPTIYQGTVMSNLDDLCVWSYPDQFYTEQDKTDDQIPEGKNVGDLKKAAHTEENQQLNMTKISDIEGDKDVAGVFWTWDNSNDDYYINDYYVAMTGDMVIRVAASTTVARGDLLISAGDGTAKPQADDIIRSSTIAKITSTNATATYDDGSKAYPCVLMAC